MQEDGIKLKQAEDEFTLDENLYSVLINPQPHVVDGVVDMIGWYDVELQNKEVGHTKFKMVAGPGAKWVAHGENKIDDRIVDELGNIIEKHYDDPGGYF